MHNHSQFCQKYSCSSRISLNPRPYLFFGIQYLLCNLQFQCTTLWVSRIGNEGKNKNYSFFISNQLTYKYINYTIHSIYSLLQINSIINSYIIVTYRVLEMNCPQETKRENAERNGQSKIKLNQLSKYIFQKIHKYREISDADLMKQLVHQFGSVKEQTLKRRKYDTVNILQKADIITIQRKQGNFVYMMKHDVPNSLKDLENVKEKVQIKQKVLQQKKQKIQMMKTAMSNYHKLFELNQVRIKQNQSIIELPVIAVNQNFLDCRSDCEEKTDIIKLKFPPGAKFINNILAHSELFNF